MTGHGIRMLGRTDQGGRPDGVQVMVARGHAYVGHMFADGISVIDVADPRAPKPGRFIACPPNTRASHIQVHDGLLLAINAANVWASAALRCRGRLFRQAAGRQFQQAGAGIRCRDAGVRPGQPGRAARNRLHAGGGHRAASHLVGGWSLRLRLGAFRRFHRPHPGGDRHGRTHAAGDRRALVVAGHAPCRRRDAVVAARASALRCTT